uniref:Uncharacterized protein n=1 Tax=Anguilla anguilla TaxID=7936 RepID=A0A0E9VU02_ANGAN
MGTGTRWWRTGAATQTHLPTGNCCPDQGTVYWVTPTSCCSGTASVTRPSDRNLAMPTQTPVTTRARHRSPVG